MFSLESKRAQGQPRGHKLGVVLVREWCACARVRSAADVGWYRGAKEAQTTAANRHPGTALSPSTRVLAMRGTDHAFDASRWMRERNRTGSGGRRARVRTEKTCARCGERSG
eukprot:1429995-Rhodomonas_salina.3